MDWYGINHTCRACSSRQRAVWNPCFSAVLGNYLYTVSGESIMSGWEFTPTERYDPKTNNWTRVDDYLFSFSIGAVATFNGEIWACGGYQHNRKKRERLCRKFNQSVNRWKYAPDMNKQRLEKHVYRAQADWKLLKCFKCHIIVLSNLLASFPSRILLLSTCT